MDEKNETTNETTGERGKGKRTFDEDKNVCLKTFGTVKDGETTLTVALYSYDGGAPKVGISRTVVAKKTGETKHVGLGRLNQGALPELIPLLEAAATWKDGR